MAPNVEYRDGEVLYAVLVTFEPNTEDPARVFRATARTVELLTALDRDLAACVSGAVEPVQLLQDVEPGSIKTWIRTVLRAVDDDALKTLDWKPAVGRYLVLAKKRVLEWCGDRHGVTSNEELESLREELRELAANTQVLQVPAYGEVPSRTLLDHLHSLDEASSDLGAGDGLTYVSPEGSVPINKGFHLSTDRIEDLLTASIEIGEHTLTMLVKKPDYLGQSMWTLKHDDHTFDAKILDDAWLARFQRREVDVRPGDAIHAKVRVETRFARDRSVVSTRVYVTKVIRVIPGDQGGEQLALPAPEP